MPAATSGIRSRGAPLANVRKERGLEPAPARKTRTTWRECLAAHGDVRAAADVFTVAVWTPRGLPRFPVLVLIHLASRRGQVAGISAEPDGPWGTQLMRHAPDAEDGCLRHPRQGFFEHPEYLAVRAHLPAPWQDILDLAYYSGWRKQEILGLT